MSDPSIDLQHYHRGPGDEPFPAELGRLRGLALLVGLIALGLCAVGAFADAQHFFRSWLFAYMFWVGLTLGCLGMVMLSHLTGGEWGVIMRRFGETAFLNLPLMLLFFLPLILGYKYLFPWAHIEDFVDNEELHRVLIHRAAWFNPAVFTIRNIVYFAIWCTFAFVMASGSRKLDEAENPRLRRTLRKFAAAGVVLYFVTVTSYAMDFVMSRETNWYSSIIGFIMVIGQAASGMAFLALAVCYFARRRPIRDVLSPQHLNDYGNLMLALVILWAYTAFAQLLVIWSGNTREDVGYYTHRGMGIVPNPWRWVALLLLVGHFLTPFFCLLMKGLKRKVNTLAGIAAFLLVMRIVDNLWLTAPSGPYRTMNRQDNIGGIYWTDLVAWLGIGGIWLFFYLWRLDGIPLLPENASDQPDPLENGLHAGHAPHVG